FFRFIIYFNIMNIFMLSKILLFITIIKSIKCELCELNNKEGYKLQFGKDKNETINFTLSLNVRRNVNIWYAIGFGRSMMGGLDIIMIRIFNGNVYVTDEFVNGYTNPTPDFQQDVTLHNYNYVDGNYIIHFSRPVKPIDTKNNIPLRDCFRWNFVMNPGTVYDFRGSISKHPGKPLGTLVCLSQCLI
ncbi:DOMON domain-containing protein, partial [Strongyloides ratti]